MRRTVVLAVSLLLSGFASAAQAQITPERCAGAELKGAQCGRVPVPLDHAAPGGEQLSLAFVRFPAAQASRGTIVFLSGGPGQAATPLAGSVANGPLRSLRRRYDLVFVDQRGTGSSSPLRCSTAPKGVFEVSSSASPERIAADVARCASELGDARRFFTTYETVLDLENLRTALNVPRIIPLGVSYGGQVAGEYARRFPQSTQAVVLDSTSPIEGTDALGYLPQLALPRVLREICFPPGCERLLGAPQELLAGAVKRLGTRGLTGVVVTPSGRRRTARIGVADLYELVRQSDVDPALRSALPAALEAASRGDAAPLLRLAVSGTGGGGSEDEGVNEVRLLATSCVEGRLPWAPTSDPATRPAILAQTMAENADRYAPFPVDAVTPQLEATLCLGWPATPRPPAPASNGPNLPVLILAGRDDLRTPLEDQRRAGMQFPNAKVVAVPGVGHSVLGTDETGCAQNALRAFLFGKRRLACPHIDLVPLALPVFRRLSELPGVAGSAPRRVEQTAVAVDLTLRDVTRQLAALSAGTAAGNGDVQRRVLRIGGLRGGRLEVRRTGFVLRTYEVVPGVRISGALSNRGVGALTVTGIGANGTVVVSRSGAFRGVLGGTAIRYRPLPVTGR